jgi:hypothetical protein
MLSLEQICIPIIKLVVATIMHVRIAIFANSNSVTSSSHTQKKLGMASVRAMAAVLKRQMHSERSQINPWFVSPKVPELVEDVHPDQQSHEPSPNMPDEAPPYLKSLHAVLQTSPFLETSQLLVSRPLPLGDGPGLPRQRTRGTRRKRKQTFAGSGIDQVNTLWDWAVYAQVK